MRLKRIALGVLLALAGLPAFGDYLYWMVDGDSYRSWDNPSFTYARIRVDGTMQYLQLSYADAPTEWGSVLAATDDIPGKAIDGAWAEIDSFYAEAEDPPARFVLELYASGQSQPARSSSFTYAMLADSIVKTIPSQTEKFPRPFGAWSVVPEPTSGLLTLFGMALLALKRKRAHSILV